MVAIKDHLQQACSISIRDILVWRDVTPRLKGSSHCLKSEGTPSLITGRLDLIVLSRSGCSYNGPIVTDHF